MASPNFNPAPLNRLVASIIWTDFTALNVTPQFLLPEAIDITFNGNVTTNIPSLTSVVPSPEPYIAVELMVHIVRTTNLATQYKTQLETNSFLGSCTVRSDAVTLGPWNLDNMSILSINPLAFSGKDAGYVIKVGGVYSINSALWN